jgi:hypothetical protein
MFSLEPELEANRARLGDARTDVLIARERREIFSVHPELRIAGWLGATLLAAAAGVMLKNNLDRIGPLALAVMIGVAAAACYAWAWWHRGRASVADDSILLVGALLVSADVAFIEAQFHIFGEAWTRHFLLLAVLHGVGAYAFRSRVLLSLSITALASYIGYGRQSDGAEFAGRAFLTSGALLAWRAVDWRVWQTTFTRAFEHFAANIALIGGLALIEWHAVVGGLVTIAIASFVIWWGFRMRHEPFVLYGFVYGVIGVDALLIDLADNMTASIFIVVVSMIAAVVGLLALHKRFKATR